MTPLDALVELLARVGAHGESVTISAEELRHWPAPAVAAMKSQRLLVKARPAASTVCPGCEQECVMPVHTLSVGTRPATSFIVCEKRPDINRVPVPAERLTQWRCDPDTVRGFIAASLGLRRSEQRPGDSALLPIGIGSGDKRKQMLGLRTDGELILVAGSGAVPLAELVVYEDGAYALDDDAVRQLVDSSTTADPRHTPSNARREAGKLDTQAMYGDWQKAYRDWKKRRPGMSDVWYSQQIAQQIAKQKLGAGRDAETIRKHMKR